VAGATVTLTDDTLSSNKAQGGLGGLAGGGVSNGVPTDGNSGGNGGAGSGGGLYVAGGTVTLTTVTLTNDTFSTNSAVGGDGARGGTGNAPGGSIPGGNGGSGGAGSGGAVDVAGGTVTLVNDTLALNNARGGGGANGGSGASGVAGNGGNGGAGSGGGLYLGGGTTVLANTLIAENNVFAGRSGLGGSAGFTFGSDGIPGSATDPDVWGTVASSDYDLIGTSNDFSATRSIGDIVNLTSKQLTGLLDPSGLQDNGGPTYTVALQPGSVAIDAGDPTAAVSATDQRGLARIVGNGIDIGAYEYNANIAITYLSVTGTASPTVLPGGLITYTLTVNNNGPNDQNNVALTDVLPANTTLVSWTAPSGWNSGAPPAGSSGTASAWIATLPTNTSASFTLVVQVASNTAAVSVINNTASVGPTNNDPDPSTSVSLQTTVQAPTSISVSAPNTTPVYGQGVTLTATVTTPAGDPLPTSTDGTVTFYDGGTRLGTVNLSGNTATLPNVLLTAGQHTIIARYSGDNNFAASQTNFEPTSPQVVVLADGLPPVPNSPVDGQGDFFYADPANSQVVEVFPDGSHTTVGSGLFFPIAVGVDSQGNVFIDDRGLFEEVEVLAGLPVTVTQAPPTISVSDASNPYSGNFFSATDSVAGVVAGVDSTPASTLEGVAPTLTYYQGTYATLAALNTALAGGLTGSSTAPTQAGSYTVVASFAGSTDYTGGSAQTTFTISPDPTSISVSASSAASVYGQGVTLTATVTTPAGEAIPTSTDGTVTFYDGGTKLGSAQVLSGSPATATLTNVILTAGQHTITASYSGDNNFVASRSGVEPTSKQKVGPPSGFAGPPPVAPSASDGQGNTFVAETLNSQVVEFKADGSQTKVGSGLVLPFDVAVDSQGNVFIDDLFLGEVEVLAGLPVTVSQAPPTVSVSDATDIYSGNPFSATDSVAGVVTGVDSKPANTLEGVGLTLDYVQLNSNGTTTDLGSSAPFLPGSYSVTASFAGSADYTSRSAMIPFTIKPPTTSITGPTIGVPGQPLTYTFKVTYGPKGPTTGITFSINYGDGPTVTTSAGGPSITLDHLYHTTNTFTIQVTAKDSNGVVSIPATQSVKISTVAMESDPSGGTALAVGGNAAGGDTILVRGTNTSGTAVSVTMNKISLGTFTPTGHILVYGQGAKETITLQPDVVGNTSYYIKVPALLYGEGSGGDHISAAGSAANNVLTGHGTNEVLTGGQGRDLLIAGTGAATLNAGTGDDILIGGSTNFDIGSSSGLTYDNQLKALDAIMAEWGSAASYATRLSALAGQLNSSTVHDNSASGKAVADQLLGNAVANDWFFAGVNDAVKGKSKNAQVTSIT
jgi:uncharacterized repeat protein (TIGR01451 family)